MNITKKKWFAWYPVKTADGWVWLKYIWRETHTQLRPILRFIGDSEYRRGIIENLNNQQAPKELCKTCRYMPSTLNCVGLTVGIDMDTGNIIECVKHKKKKKAKKLIKAIMAGIWTGLKSLFWPDFSKRKF